MTTSGYGSWLQSVPGRQHITFSECCGTGVFHKYNGNFVLKGYEGYGKEYHLNQGAVLNSNFTGDSRRIYMVMGASKEEALRLAYSDEYRAKHPVEALELHDPESGTVTITWVNE